jgi:hypothetical protein
LCLCSIWRHMGKQKLVPLILHLPLLVASWSAAISFLALWVLIPSGAWMSVLCDCCELSSRVLCVRLMNRPGEAYRWWCVWVWSLDNKKALAQSRLLLEPWKKSKILTSVLSQDYSSAELTWAKNHRYQFNRGLVGLRSRSGSFGGEKNFLPAPQIETSISRLPPHSPVALRITLFQLNL